MRRAKVLGAVLLSVVTVAPVAAATAGSAAAATVAPVPYAGSPLDTWRPADGKVSAVVRVGNTVYLGGTFTAMRNASGSQKIAVPRLAAIGAVARARLAALDPVTGTVVSTTPVEFRTPRA